ncbi:MAG: hypothetical protein ACLVMH_05540 [Christensenellales bacterium]
MPNRSAAHASDFAKRRADDVEATGVRLQKKFFTILNENINGRISP